MEGSRIGGGKVIEEELKALRIKEGQFQKEALAAQRLHRPVQVETLEAVGGGQERLDASGGDTATHDGQEATATFVLGPHAPLPIAPVLGGLQLGYELSAERLLEVRALLGLFFGWERRGALGLARKR